MRYIRRFLLVLVESRLFTVLQVGAAMFGLFILVANGGRGRGNNVFVVFRRSLIVQSFHI